MNPESETERGGAAVGVKLKKKTLKVIMQNYPTDSPIAEKVNFTVLYAKEYINENNLYLCQTEIIIIII